MYMYVYAIVINDAKVIKYNSDFILNCERRNT